MKDNLFNRLKKLRAKSGETQEQLADKLKVSRSKVSSWETGRRYISVQDAIILSEYFDVSLDNLLNPKVLNKEEYVKISDRFFNSKKITFQEKEEVLKHIREVFLVTNSEEIYPLTRNDSNY